MIHNVEMRKGLIVLGALAMGALMFSCATTTTTIPVELDVPVVTEAGPIERLIVYFEEDSSILTERTKSALRPLSYLILQSMDTVEEIVVDGHVALAGTSEGRTRISEERGNRVTAYLVELGVPQSLINTMSLEATRPVASNNTDEGRVLNRRVEIQVVIQN